MPAMVEAAGLFSCVLSIAGRVCCTLRRVCVLSGWLIVSCVLSLLLFGVAPHCAVRRPSLLSFYPHCTSKALALFRFERVVLSRPLNQIVQPYRSAPHVTRACLSTPLIPRPLPSRVHNSFHANRLRFHPATWPHATTVRSCLWALRHRFPRLYCKACTFDANSTHSRALITQRAVHELTLSLQLYGAVNQ